MSYRPRTDKPSHLRPNSFKGQAFEITSDTGAGANLRDINGENIALSLLAGVGRMGASVCSNSEPMQALLLDNDFAYSRNVYNPSALRESGTFWIAFKRIQSVTTGYYELINANDNTANYRTIYVTQNGNDIFFGNGTTYNNSSGAALDAVDSLNVIGYSWDANGFRGYFQGDEIWTNATAPVGTGELDEISIGTWLHSTSTTFLSSIDLYSTRILPRALSAAEHKAWADDIWLPYRESRIILPPKPAVIGGVTIPVFNQHFRNQGIM